MKLPSRSIGVGGGHFSGREKEYVNQVMDSERLSYGDFSRSFEEKIALLHERKFALFCNSGTSALQVALDALKKERNWKDGDEIIVPALTFVATVNIVLQNNLTPVFVDINPLHFDMASDKIEDKITPKTRAIIPVHIMGQPADMNPIMEIAQRNKLAVLEDSCEAMFVRYQGRAVGSFGDIACFSTYMSHLITTGVGGFAATNDPSLATRMRSLFNHGRDGIYISIDDDDLLKGEKLRQVISRRFSFVDVGYSYRATELEAAIGLAQCERWEEIISTRQGIAQILTQGLSDLDEHLILPTIRLGSEHAFMAYPLVLRDGKKRDALLQFLEERQIETRYLLPLLNQPVYIKIFGNIENHYPVAQNINQCGFYIGCHGELTKDDLQYVIATFHEFFDSY